MVKNFVKEKFNPKIKSSQFDHENHTKPEEKGANRHIEELTLGMSNRVVGHLLF